MIILALIIIVFVFLIIPYYISKVLDTRKELINKEILSPMDLIKNLIKEGRDINERDENGYTLLFTAVNNNHLEEAKYLIENGADIEIKYNVEYTFKPSCNLTLLEILEFDKDLYESMGCIIYNQEMIDYLSLSQQRLTKNK